MIRVQSRAVPHEAFATSENVAFRQQFPRFHDAQLRCRPGQLLSSTADSRPTPPGRVISSPLRHRPCRHRLGLNNYVTAWNIQQKFEWGRVKLEPTLTALAYDDVKISGATLAVAAADLSGGLCFVCRV